MPFLHVSFLKCLRIYSIGVFVVYGSRSAPYNAYERKYMNMSNLILLCRHPRSNLPATQPLWTLTSTCAYIRYRRTYFYYTSSEYIVRDDNDASTTGMMVYYSYSLRVCVYDYIIWWWKYFCFNKIHCENGTTHLMRCAVLWHNPPIFGITSSSRISSHICIENKYILSHLKYTVGICVDKSIF